MNRCGIRLVPITHREKDIWHCHHAGAPLSFPEEMDAQHRNHGVEHAEAGVWSLRCHRLTREQWIKSASSFLCSPVRLLRQEADRNVMSAAFFIFLFRPWDSEPVGKVHGAADELRHG